MPTNLRRGHPVKTRSIRIGKVDRISPELHAELIKLYERGELEEVLRRVKARVMFKQSASRWMAAKMLENVHELAIILKVTATQAVTKTVKAEGSKYVRTISSSARAE